MSKEPTTLLKVLVGSRAHGLANPDSDYDYRSVYIVPTSRILSLGPKAQDTLWKEKTDENKEDATGWELGHFLFLATKCNPTILEVFAAPIVEYDRQEEGSTWVNSPGYELQQLLPYVWNPIDVANAFIGYGHNQQKKLLENKDQRGPKYAVAYLRVLYQAHILLTEKRMVVDMSNTSVFKTLRKWRQGDFTNGEVIDTTASWKRAVQETALQCKQEPDLNKVNKFLLEMRDLYWHER